jgi:hypothetical protein
MNNVHRKDRQNAHRLENYVFSKNTDSMDDGLVRRNGSIQRMRHYPARGDSKVIAPDNPASHVNHRPAAVSGSAHKINETGRI